MHPRLYPKIIALREKIRLLRQELDDASRDFDPKGVWKPWHGKGEACPVAGADGSFNYLQRLGFTLAGATGASFYSGDESGDFFLAELDIVRPGEMEPGEMMGLFQSGSKIMEAKALALSCRKIRGGMGMVDGALRGIYKNYTEDMGPARVARIAGLAEDREGQQRLWRWALDLLPALGERIEEDWASWGLRREIFGLEEDPRFRLGLLLALCRHEYLLSVRRILLADENQLLGVAKTSSECTYHDGVPDIYLFTIRTSAPGYTEPRPVALPRDDDLPEKPCSFFYARTEERGGVFRMEVFAKPEEVDPEAILSVLLPTSVAGYPYPLSKAHKLCTLSFEALAKYLELAGGKHEPTGREAL